MATLKPFESGNCVVIDSDGVGVSHPKKELIGDAVGGDVTEHKENLLRATARSFFSGSNEQASNVEEMTSSFGEMGAGITQNAASSSEGLAATSENLGSQAEKLYDMISFFRIDENSSKVKLVEKKEACRMIKNFSFIF